MKIKIKLKFLIEMSKMKYLHKNQNNLHNSINFLQYFNICFINKFWQINPNLFEFFFI